MIAWSGRRQRRQHLAVVQHFLLLVSPWAIGAKDKHGCIANAQEHGRGLLSVTCLARPHRDVSYDIHAMFAARRCASARVDSRDPIVDSVLIAGHAGTAAWGCGSAWDQPCGVTGGAAPWRAGSAGASWLRELTPSLVKTLRRW